LVLENLSINILEEEAGSWDSGIAVAEDRRGFDFVKGVPKMLQYQTKGLFPIG
jgi:hypothetical protein